jgi:hypothetical protein
MRMHMYLLPRCQTSWLVCLLATASCWGILDQADGFVQALQPFSALLLYLEGKRTLRRICNRPR